jgi:ABC-2 type transport system permease protein
MDVDPLMVLSPGESLRQPLLRQVSIYPESAEPPLENPLAPAGGVFDLSFVVIWLFPLTIVAATHGVVSADRQLGTWPLVAATSTSPAGVLAARLAWPAGMLTAITVVAGLVAVLLSGPLVSMSGWLRWLAWSGVVTAYALFWSFVAGAVTARSSTAAASLARAGLLWVALTWVVPGVVDAVVAGSQPPPNPVEAYVAAREIERDLEARLPAMMEAVYGQHPEWRPTPAAVTAATTPIPGGPASRDSRRVYTPALAAAEVAAPFERATTDRREKTEDIVRRWSLVSPALAVQSLTDHLAGTSAERFVLFDRHVASLEATWQAFFAPRIMRLQEMTRADMDQVPRVSPFATRPTAARIAWPVSGLLASLLAAFCVLRLSARHINR